MRARGAVFVFSALILGAGPVLGQFTVLDDGATGETDPAPAQTSAPCGSRPFTIARMPWPSAALLADIHARILETEFDCAVEIVPGDPAATISAMTSTGEPAAVPELWVNRIVDVWNGALDAQMVRSAAPVYTEDRFEGWFMPSYMAGSATPPEAASLDAFLAPLQAEGPLTFISCPIDWACSVINRNLVTAYGIEGQVEIVEPANRLEMDRLIAEAVNRRDPFLFYYWQPNAVLAQLDFTPLDMGQYSEEAAKCLAERDCAEPQPSSFVPDLVVSVLADRVFTDIPEVAGYFQRATLPLAEMDRLLAELNAPGASPELVAEQFVSERRDLWGGWLGETVDP